MPRKNVEDKLRAVNHPPLNDLFDIALLGWTQVVIEQENIGIHRSGRARDFLELARADQGRRIGPVAPLENFADDLRPGALRQRPQFRQ